jgi:hypothetical protein
MAKDRDTHTPARAGSPEAGDPVQAGDVPAPAATIRERRVREGRVWRMAFLASLVLHVLIFLLGPRGSVLISPFAAAGPRSGDDVAAEGSMEAVALRSPPPDAAQPPPIPVLDVEFPEPEVVTPDATPEVDLDAPELPEPGTGSSDGADPEERGDAGIPTATGAGDAGTAEEGRFRVVPPSPRGMIMPPTNRDLRGTEVEVWVFVDENGRVVPDSTRLEPPTRDRRFNQELIRQAGEWVFDPARRDGEPVAAWFPYRINL